MKKDYIITMWEKDKDPNDPTTAIHRVHLKPSKTKEHFEVAGYSFFVTRALQRSIHNDGFITSKYNWVVVEEITGYKVPCYIPTTAKETREIVQKRLSEYPQDTIVNTIEKVKAALSLHPCIDYYWNEDKKSYTQKKEIVV